MERRRSVTTYRHREAFALMWYRCPCGHTERFWNSRDGVTPFGGVQCPSCGERGLSMTGGLSHAAFHLDQTAPDHRPHPGQRIWRDGTQAEAIAILDRRFQAFADRGHPVPKEAREKMISEIGSSESEFSPGWPMWERTPEGRP
jgi:hypothetical protein